MIAQIRNLINEYRSNGTIRFLYQSLEKSDITSFNSILAKLQKENALSEILPNLLGFVCENVKVTDFLISVLALGIHPDIPNQSGQFPLHLAVENGNEEFVRILLRFGADPNIADENGVTALHISNSYDSLGGIADLLIANGADLNLRDKLGKRYLM